MLAGWQKPFDCSGRKEYGDRCVRVDTRRDCRTGRRTSSRVHLRNPIAHSLVLRVKSVFARYSLGSLKESPYSLRAFRLPGRSLWSLPQFSGPTELCGRSTTEMSAHGLSLAT